MDEDVRSDREDPVARLTDGQLECLRLVGRHFSSKEIATLLAISPHTVDQRIRTALRTLGVKRRADAARFIDGTGPGGGGVRDAGAPAAGEPRHVAAIDELSPDLSTERRSFDLPFATRRRPSNRMTALERIVWIILIASASTLVAGFSLAALESVERMIGN